MKAYRWGNATYLNLAIGESYEYKGKSIVLISMRNQFCTVKVGETESSLSVVRRGLPTELEGVRVFVADNQNVKWLTSDDEYHGLLEKDALLCLSDASKPLLDPERYTFPISRRDGYCWDMEEASHMYAYYGHAWYFRSDYHLSKGDKFYRSHEGIDFNMHDGRGIQKHPLVAVESGEVVMVHQVNKDETCIILKSDSDANIYYIYKHCNVRYCYVMEGQHVEKGTELGCIWGDNVWGHLHFAVVHQESLESYNNRYFNLLNCYPQVLELWHGDLTPRPRVWTEGKFTFGHKKWQVENKLRSAAYDDIVGYGWQIGEWCTACGLEKNREGNLRVTKVLHEGTKAECVNPNDYYDFDIAVENGTYTVSVMVGDINQPSWQKLSFNDVDAGTYEQGANQFTWTPEHRVEVTDDRLTVRLGLRDRNTPAGITELHFLKKS